MKTPFGKRNTRRCWISGQFPLETFTNLLAKHLETFRELERLQVSALEGVKNQGLEGLTAMLVKQQEIMTAIAREKGELRPYLDQWEGLQAEERTRLRAGRPGDILLSLETVAQAIHARHQEMFGADDSAAPGAAGAGAAGTSKDAGASKEAEKQPDLSQMINIYRSMQ